MHARLFPLFALTACSALAGSPDLENSIIVPASNSPWRVGVGYAQLLGLKTNFTGLGNFVSPNTLQPLGNGIARDYDNGYVRIDSSGNLGGQTWNWSYQDNAQYNPAGTGSIDYSITNSLGNARADEDGGDHHGVDLFAYYDMGAAGFKGLGNRQATWGFRAGLQYSRVNIGNSDFLTTGLTTTTDSYDLGGVIPPLAPFVGNPNGPGPLLSDNPTRSTVLGGTGLVSGSRELDIDLTLINLGSYLEIPVTEKLNFLAEAGVSLGIASGSYEFQSATTVAGLGAQNSNGKNSSTDLLPGVYIGLGATYQINESWALLGSGRYQYLQSYDLEANGSQASLSFDSAFILSISCVYSF